MALRRIEGSGWLALIGGGEFSFGETEEVDAAWLSKLSAETIGFLPTASGSVEYAQHFASYLDETFDRRVEVVPIYRGRDARRQRNLERIETAAGLYLGGGVADDLLEVLSDSPAEEALAARLRNGGVVVAIAAAAQSLGAAVRGLRGATLPGLGWLPRTAIETNFSPAHDRRLRDLLATPEVDFGLGLAAGSGLLLGPQSEVEIIGTVFSIDGVEGDIEILSYE